jgi:hypothetical protein
MRPKAQSVAGALAPVQAIAAEAIGVAATDSLLKPARQDQGKVSRPMLVMGHS